MKYILIDASNLFWRMRHMSHKQTTTHDKLGFCLHTTLNSVAKVWREQKANHVVFAFEGRSWRKDFYPPYKKNREVNNVDLSDAEIAESTLFYDTYNELVDFVVNKTNCTTLHHPELEADDLIAGWIASHPNDEHVIVSSDTDFYQLIASNVTQYNGITDETITLNGFFNYKGKPIIDKKTKTNKLLGDPQWILFEKCMRGDPTDNVFSAYPGVRKKGTKNKVGLLEAYSDKGRKGYNWNNLMLQQFLHHDGTEHRVLDDYNRNVTLIDLSAQLPEIKLIINQTIAANSYIKNVPQIGSHFLKFCGKHQLIKLSERADMFAQILAAAYK